MEKTSKTGRKTRSGQRPVKARKNLSLAPEVLALLLKLKALDRRDASNEVAWLVEGEAKRRGLISSDGTPWKKEAA